jgi:hypothetical protein
MSAVPSPLFEPVLWHDDGFEILDEIQVPQQIRYIHVTDVAEALDAVRQMKTRAFGQVLTFLYSAGAARTKLSLYGSGVFAGPIAATNTAILRRAADLRFCRSRHYG